MSMTYCHKCGHYIDTDFDAEHDCSDQVNNPLREYARDLSEQAWKDAMIRERDLQEAKHLNALSNNFAYTDGSDAWYRREILRAKKHREGCFKAMLHFT